MLKLAILLLFSSSLLANEAFELHCSSLEKASMPIPASLEIHASLKKDSSHHDQLSGEYSLDNYVENCMERSCGPKKESYMFASNPHKHGFKELKGFKAYSLEGAGSQNYTVNLMLPSYAFFTKYIRSSGRLFFYLAYEFEGVERAHFVKIQCQIRKG